MEGGEFELERKSPVLKEPCWGVRVWLMEASRRSLQFHLQEAFNRPGRDEVECARIEEMTPAIYAKARQAA